jgi:hypothetical protein
LNHGAYARAFHYTLENGFQLVARVILPARKTIKTEAEISTMEMVRCTYPFTYSTSILIIDLHSTNDNSCPQGSSILQHAR